MGVSLYLLILILILFIGMAVLIARSNREDDTYADLETDEWDCPECGFHIQAGDTCIYCCEEKHT
ncbi:MAG: hypothetical protein QF616_05320 [Candidatus Marinimicrobia bacterium]|jgi:hypothetical protein|nr:hypothetical protein [Candidatus Neomarinimicrobiota bacterium]MDP6275406.1 hypothetical protein [Candidatus Neomarinimicrobiota bacterium]MDP6755252.1 hypothetical protein [Candidatus Neomarinimicrobiota bacterium]MDP7565794.1 hypothetical protein [Candidatus Neomarinimicrobiota bacterium]|tara:strand:- start:2554 stop:2748 length:195 start_codon:yes stop_codon:yes gene_type:complete